MSIRSSSVLKMFAAAALVSCMVAVSAPALAGEMTAQQIENGLKLPRTRGLSPAARPGIAAADVAFINTARGRTRSLSMDDRAQMAEIVSKRPRIDLDITFEYDSASLSPKAEPQLANLARALTGPELVGSVIMLGGHTDAKGGESYNQQLSERRAETVKRFLVARYKIAPNTLITAGYGKKDMKNVADPLAAENRRVEIVNMAQRDEASAQPQ